MIIDNKPANEAIMSNVGEIGEFRIRNSAKAFNILSSGLYANKIRAIIRELSCNAVDSHTAAGKQATPFDVHLPNTIDPTFSIRDYGTGLTHEQVQNIYTTYFESTKTESNAFIGALGLGSKSPFSYTDNFTVTAIKDGVRGVYSAFINGEGVPSIALMHSEPTDQPAGVEVKFAVDNRHDFYKFEEEARYVYTYFALRPVVSGGEGEFRFRDVEYKEKNIIPGVHYTDGRGSRAVMGNIAYPIEVPNPEQLGEVASLLSCGLEMHFDIGELDFQASREGLSYIPQTVNAIKAKLEALNAQLSVHVQMEADTYTNQWEKMYFLQEKSHQSLFGPAARKYIIDTKFDMLNADRHYVQSVKMAIDVKDLASKYNIEILAFQKARHGNTCYELKASKRYLKPNDYTAWENEWHFNPDHGTIFVENDTKIGAYTRAKYHWRHAPQDAIPNKGHSANVYVMQAVDKSKTMDVVGFMAELKNPPASQCVKASTLIQKERKETGSRGKDVRILRMEMKDYGRGRRDVVAWTEAGSADQYDTTKTYYYIPLSGYSPVNSSVDPKTLYMNMRNCGLTHLTNMTIYGVRKGDIEFIKTQKNWIELETHLVDFLGKLDPNQLAALAMNEVDKHKVYGYNSGIVINVTNAASPYLVLVSKFKGISKVNFSSHHLNRLLSSYAPGVSFTTVVDTLKAEIAAVRNRYPLLNDIRDYGINELAVAEYVNLVDSSKGI